MKIFDIKECRGCVHDRKSRACVFCGNTDGNRKSRAVACSCESCNETEGTPREQFQAQFKQQVFVTDEFLNLLRLDQVMFNTPVYRALNKLVIIKDDGNYYIS